MSTIGITIYCIQYIVCPDKILYVSLYFGVLFGYWRCFNYIQVFGQGIRTNVIMYQSTIIDLIPFLTILLLFQLSFTVSRIVLFKEAQQNNTDPENKAYLYTIPQYFMRTSGQNWMQMYGENPPYAQYDDQPEDDVPDMNYKDWIAYILSSFLINIVGLNLLISVIGDNYAKVTSKLNSIDYKARLNQILQIEKSLQRVQPQLKQDYSRQYLHVIKYQQDEEIKDPLTDKLNQLNRSVDRINSSIKK